MVPNPYPIMHKDGRHKQVAAQMTGTPSIKKTAISHATSPTQNHCATAINRTGPPHSLTRALAGAHVLRMCRRSAWIVQLKLTGSTSAVDAEPATMQNTVLARAPTR
jgi:hypothetical protein